MTLHVPYDHQCPACGAYYIPYDDDVPCPNCGLVEDERFDFIPQAANSALFNIRHYGSYVPPAWYVGSLGDHILRLLFLIFDAYEQSGATDFPTFAQAAVDRMCWGNQQYLANHVRDIAIRVYEEVQRNLPDELRDKPAAD